MFGTIVAGAMLSIFSPNAELVPPPQVVTDGHIEQVSTSSYLQYLKRKQRRLKASIAAGNSQDIPELQRVNRKIRSLLAQQSKEESESDRIRDNTGLNDNIMNKLNQAAEAQRQVICAIDGGC